jgi:hypothetical protein
MLGLTRLCCCSIGHCNRGKQRKTFRSKRNTQLRIGGKAIIIVHEGKNNTPSLSMFVRFLILGESVPERFMLRASLPNNEANTK